MTLAKFIRKNYTTACRLQHDIIQDRSMVSMLRSATSQHNEAEVVSWMRAYGLLQGIEGADRIRVAKSYLSYARQCPTGRLKATRVKPAYAALFRQLHGQKARGWLSGSSKLLWCLYPYDIIIYDQFVWRAIVVLQKLDPALLRSDSIGKAPSAREASDIEDATAFYMRYEQLVRTLLDSYRPLLQELRHKHGETYKYDVRIFDKLLWILGNPSPNYPS